MATDATRTLAGIIFEGLKMIGRIPGVIGLRWSREGDEFCILAVKGLRCSREGDGFSGPGVIGLSRRETDSVSLTL